MDERLRELERRAREEGSAEAEEEWLHQRLRRGDLALEWLAVAAHLGHPAARRVLGRFVPIATYETVLGSLQHDAWPREACMRTAALWVEPEATGKLEQAALGVLALSEGHGERAPLEALRQGARDPLSTVLDTALAPSEAGAQASLRSLLPPRRPGQPAAPGEGRRLREALLPWALRGAGQPPAGLLPPDPAAWEGYGAAPAPDRADHREFRRALETPEVAQRASALSRQVRERTLARERLRLAAFLGDPAAWRAAAPSGEPELSAPQHAGAMAGSLLAALARLATKGLPREPERRADLLARIQADPSDLPRGLAFPLWWREWIPRLGLAAARAALQAQPEVDARSLRALQATQAFLREPGGDAGPLEAALDEAAAAVQGRRLDPRGQAAARAALAAGRLALALATTARQPTFVYRRQDVLDQTLGAGVTPAALWALLRREAIEWALGAASGGLRAYRPEDRYLPGELLEHPSFGEGRVLRVDRDRVEVEFSDERRVLQQGDAG